MVPPLLTAKVADRM